MCKIRNDPNTIRSHKSKQYRTQVYNLTQCTLFHSHMPVWDTLYSHIVVSGNHVSTPGTPLKYFLHCVLCLSPTFYYTFPIYNVVPISARAHVLCTMVAKRAHMARCWCPALSIWGHCKFDNKYVYFAPSNLQLYDICP
jgi:hypothetical protein